MKIVNRAFLFKLNQPSIDESFLILHMHGHVHFIGGFSMADNKTRRLVGIALLSALAFVITFLEIPLIPGVPFLKLDFSDIVVFFGMYIFGPLSGVMIAFLRALLQYVSTGGDAGFPIGVTAGFIATISMTLPLYLIVSNRKFNLKNKIIGGTIATVSLTVVLSVVNWLFVLPAYLVVMGLDVGPVRDYLLYALIPFNLLKGTIISTLIFFLAGKMKVWLDKTRAQYHPKKIEKLKFEN